MRAQSTCRMALFLTLLATPAAGQTKPDASHWGVAGGIVPKWRSLSSAKVLFTVDDLDMSGRELRIGIVRGRPLSGDWGVSFVRRSFESNTTLPSEESGESCTGGYSHSGAGSQWTGTLNCQASQVAYLPFEVMLNGVEVHKFVPFGTIRGRVQIGLNVAGGAGWTNGSVRLQRRNVEYTRAVTGPASQPPVFGEPGPETVRQVTEQTVGFKQLLQGGISSMPFGKLELAVAVITAPGLKVRVSGGLNFPGTQTVAITALYLFGQ